MALTDELWNELIRNGFALTGSDNTGGIDGLLDVDDDGTSGPQNESGDVDEPSDGDSSEDADDDDGDGDGDEHRLELNRLKRQNRKLRKDLEAATELLNEHAERESQEYQSDYEELESRYNSLLEFVQNDFVEYCITSSFKNKDGSPRWEWEDASAVMRFLDLDELELDLETRTIDGLEEQLEEIAEQYPFLLKRQDRQVRRRRAGSPPGKPAGRNKGDDKKTEDWYAQHFPAMLG